MRDDVKNFEDWQLLESIFDYATENNIAIHKGRYTDRNKCGKHLLDPDHKELLEAVNDAASRGFTDVWYHASVQYKFKLIRGGKYNE